MLALSSFIHSDLLQSGQGSKNSSVWHFLPLVCQKSANISEQVCGVHCQRNMSLRVPVPVGWLDFFNIELSSWRYWQWEESQGLGDEGKCNKPVPLSP